MLRNMAFLLGTKATYNLGALLREAGRHRKATYNLGALSKKRGDADMAYGKTQESQESSTPSTLQQWGEAWSGWGRGRGA